MTPLIILENGRNHPIQLIKDTFQNAGLRVIISFDSRHTRVAETTILCPTHGIMDCGCHIIIMLVYGMEDLPATLIFHVQDKEIWVSLTYPPGLRPSGLFLNQITKILQTNLISNRDDFPSKINPAGI